MKYKIVQSSIGKYSDLYDLVDEYGKKHTWEEWPGIFESPVNVGYKTLYTDSNHKLTHVNVHIPFNEDNPQESIDRIKRLAMLK